MLGTALLMLTSLISNIMVKALIELTTTFVETFAFIQIDELQLTRGLQAGSSLLFLALAICVLLKVLPSTKLSWNDVWLGALVAAALLVGLQQLTTSSVVSIGRAVFILRGHRQRHDFNAVDIF